MKDVKDVRVKIKDDFLPGLATPMGAAGLNTPTGQKSLPPSSPMLKPSTPMLKPSTASVNAAYTQ